MGELDARLQGREERGAPASARPPPVAEPEVEGETVATLVAAEPPPEEYAPEANGTEPEDGAEQSLPDLETLTRRVPPAVASALDELFRTKWTGVRRLRPEDVKGG